MLFAVDLPSNGIDWLAELFKTTDQLTLENQQLRNEALLLKAKLQKLQALEAENIRLQGLLDSSFKIGEQFISASLLNVNRNKNTQHVTIDKGSQYQLEPGQPALNDQGVLGQILDVSPLTSSIILITDPNHAIPVEINRTGFRTIATGTGERNALTLPFLPHNTDIKEGDLLTTSGLGGVFPAGYPVATVSELKPVKGEAFLFAKASTIAKIENTRELLLVWSNKNPIPIVERQPQDINGNTDGE